MNGCFLNFPLCLFFVAVCFFQKIGSYHIPCGALCGALCGGQKSTVKLGPIIVELNEIVVEMQKGTGPKVMCGQGAFVIYSLYELNKCTGRNKG